MFQRSSPSHGQLITTPLYGQWLETFAIRLEGIVTGKSQVMDALVSRDPRCETKKSQRWGHLVMSFLSRCFVSRIVLDLIKSRKSTDGT